MSHIYFIEFNHNSSVKERIFEQKTGTDNHK